MRLRQCDNCGKQGSFELKWFRISDETTQRERTMFDLDFTRADQYELCSWDCVRDFAILKLTEAEVSA